MRDVLSCCKDNKNTENTIVLRLPRGTTVGRYRHHERHRTDSGDDVPPKCSLFVSVSAIESEPDWLASHTRLTGEVPLIAPISGLVVRKLKHRSPPVEEVTGSPYMGVRSCPDAKRVEHYRLARKSFEDVWVADL